MSPAARAKRRRGQRPGSGDRVAGGAGDLGRERVHLALQPHELVVGEAAMESGVTVRLGPDRGVLADQRDEYGVAHPPGVAVGLQPAVVTRQLVTDSLEPV